MSTTQITACRPNLFVRNYLQLHHLSSTPCSLAISGKWLPRTDLMLTANASHHQRSMPVCSLGGKGNVEGGSGGFPWKVLQNIIRRLKGRSLEDELRKQIEKKEFYSDSGSGSGSGRNRPPGGGGGGNGGDGSGGSEDEGLIGILDETLQVILATIGFIFLYTYIISGEEMTRLAKDYIKYLFGGSPSARLRRTMYKWGRFYKKLTEKKVVDEYWLEKAIINTETWWDSPEKYRQLLRSIASDSDSDK